jgi:O-glycosyl hydrolase
MGTMNQLRSTPARITLNATMRTIPAWAFAFVYLSICYSKVFGQSEVSGWGNLRGIRVGGQLVRFTTAVGVYDSDRGRLTLSQREGPTHTSKYVRDGNTVTVGESLQLGGRGNAATIPATRPNPPSMFSYTMSYSDSAPGVCDVSIQITSSPAQANGGIYYFLNLPNSDFADGTAELIGGPSTRLSDPPDQGRYLSGNCTGVQVSGTNGQKVEVNFPQALGVVVQRRGRENSDIQISFPIIGQSATFTLKASADVDTSPATVTLDPNQTGRTWLGIGGNYRLQNQRLDPLHIQYIFDHLRVAFGRVAMPLNAWQPQENTPATGPSTRGRGGAMNSVPSAMEMARNLAQRKIPMIISCWSAPAWALQPAVPGQRGRRLNPEKWDSICKSIGSYLLYLRDNYGAEPEFFSFNESNIGIDILQSPEEHDEAIKKLGACFKSIGLKTKMLLGDTGDAPPVDFISIALNDPDAIPFIGAVSFHSWRGATDDQYQKWADAAAKLGLPLIDAEGGGDAQASGYPNIFREDWYALDEAAEYVRIMRICQPMAILEWQLTENYSVLSTDATGGLHPSRRFFNLKQFNLAPAGSAWMAVQSNKDLILPAAFVDQATGIYTVHLVNNGASRQATITGLPASVSKMSVYITDKDRGMAKLDSLDISQGSAKITLQGQSLTTLINDN